MPGYDKSIYYKLGICRDMKIMLSYGKDMIGIWKGYGRYTYILHSLDTWFIRGYVGICNQ